MSEKYISPPCTPTSASLHCGSSVQNDDAVISQTDQDEMTFVNLRLNKDAKYYSVPLRDGQLLLKSGNQF